MHEWKVLLAHIKADKEYRIARRHFRTVGLALYLKKIAVIRQLIEYYLKRRKRRMEERYRLLMEGLRRRHDNEAVELRRRYRALERLERRETFTFEQKFGEKFAADDRTQTETPLSVRFELGTVAFLVGEYPIIVSEEHMNVSYDRNITGFEFAPLPDDYTASAIFKENPADYSTTWTRFHENAADITQPIIFSFMDDDESVRDNPGERGSYTISSILPGA
jgi:hypothetical protein